MCSAHVPAHVRMYACACTHVHVPQVRCEGMEEFPADLLLLASSKDSGMCYVVQQVESAILAGSQLATLALPAEAASPGAWKRCALRDSH